MRFEANISLQPGGRQRAGQPRGGQEPQLVPRGAAQHRVRDAAPEPRSWMPAARWQQETMGWDEAARRHRAPARQGRRPRLPLLPRAGPAAAGAEPRSGWRRSAPACRSCPTPSASASWPPWACRVYDASLLAEDQAVAAYFERALAAARPDEAKAIANWIVGELFRLMAESRTRDRRREGHAGGAGRAGAARRRRAPSPIPSPRTSSPRCSPPARRPRPVVAERGLTQISDTGALEAMVAGVVRGQPAAGGRLPGRQGGGAELPGGPGDEGQPGPRQPGPGGPAAARGAGQGAPSAPPGAREGRALLGRVAAGIVSTSQSEL